jgi:cation diffusion facilitator CzcD-associated flavoprotein CzcO
MNGALDADTGQPTWPAIVVGAGPAGLATSRELKRRGIRHLVLERGDRPGYVWANLYGSLKLHTGRHLSHLPGLALPRGVPLFVPRADFAAYLADYARRFDLPVRTGIEVRQIDRQGEGWRLDTSAGRFRAETLVMATGVVSNPRRPGFPGEAEFRGRILHAVDYHEPGDLPKGRVLVVGAGNSGGDIAVALADAGRTVEIAIRSGVNVVPYRLAGIPIQYLSKLLLFLPRPLRLPLVGMAGRLVRLRRGPSPLPLAKISPIDAIPMIGFHLEDAVKASRIVVRPGIACLTAEGAVFTDGEARRYDAIVLATGYAPALAALGTLVRLDDKGFALRNGPVQSADQPGLYFVGHRYDAAGAISNIARDAGRAAAAIAKGR